MTNENDFFEFDYDAMKEKVDGLILSIDRGESPFLEDEDFIEIIEFLLEDDLAQRALDICEFALQQHPNHSNLLILKADALVDLEEIDDAEEILKENVFIEKDDANYYILLSEIEQKRDRLDEAKEILQEGLEHCDEDIDSIYLQLADISEIEEDFQKVLLYLKKSIENNVDNEEAFNRLWFCVELTETHKESISFHESIIENHPYCLNAWYNLSHAYSGLGNLDKAIESLEFVLAIDEEYELAFLDCADLYFRKNNIDKALEYYLEADKIFKQHKDVYLNMGICYAYNKQYNKARIYFRKAISQDNEMAEAHYLIGKTYSDQLKYDNAITSTLKAVKYDPLNLGYLHALGELYTKSEAFKKSIEVYQKLIETESDNIFVWINLALNYFYIGEEEFAIEILNKADLLHLNNFDLGFTKFIMHYEMGHKKEALLELGKILYLDYEKHHLIFSLNPNLLKDSDITDFIDQFKH